MRFTPTRILSCTFAEKDSLEVSDEFFCFFLNTAQELPSYTLQVTSANSQSAKFPRNYDRSLLVFIVIKGESVE